MKNKLLPLIVILALAASAQAQDTLYVYKSGSVTHKIAALDIDSITFAKPNPFPADNGAPALSDNKTNSFKALLEKADPAKALAMGSIKITDAQYQEIKVFTDNLMKTKNIDVNNKTAVYNAIFSWITTNIKYDASDNDPYPVFINKKAICEGYSNLAKVMLISQNIPTIVVNGDYVNLGAHAWNYSYVGDKWVVGDFTNGGRYNMTDLNKYQHLKPYYTDLVFGEDDNFVYGFHYSLNVAAVKTAKEQFTVPFSALDYQISSFTLNVEMSDNVKSFYLGKNIRYLGENESNLRLYCGSSVTDIYVDKDNPYFESYNGMVYAKNKQLPYFIPPAKEVIAIKAAPTIEKNTIVNHEHVKEIRFAPGTKVIASYAVESCPNLLKVYVPASVTEIQENAFYDVNPNVQIIRE